jgi:hypothetical protein
MPNDQDAAGVQRLVWEAREAAVASGYLPALGWADLADQAWRLMLEHPESRGRLAPLASDYAAHALHEVDAARKRHR